MKKKWLKKGSAVLLAVAMVLSLFPGMKGTLETVQAAENTAPTSGYFTDVNGLKGFSLDEAGDTVGKIIFGQNGSGQAQKWKIAGTDNGIAGDNIILFADTSFGTSEFASGEEDRTFDYGEGETPVYANHYASSVLRNLLQGYSSNQAYFSSSEQGKMNDTTIYTDDTCNNINYTTTDKLYAAYGDSNNNQYVTVGTNSSFSLNDGVKIYASKWGGADFWLRSPKSDTSIYARKTYSGGGCVSFTIVTGGGVSVVPAFNLNLSDASFASAADAASSSYSGYKANDTNGTMTENTYTLRYPSAGTESAVISGNWKKVTVTNASGKYLMVQNSTGVYALKINSDNQTVNASEITMESALDNFNHCKVWLESTDTDRITTAKMATHVAAATINSVAVTDITAPVGGSSLDGTAVCATTGVTSTTPTVTWTPNDTKAGYNTAYTASVTLIADDNYEFATSGVTATINGQNATSVTNNVDGTITVTFAFPATDKEKLTSITAPIYTITAGAGGTHELNSDGTLTITCDGALDKLSGIYVEDELVDAANYTLKSESTILTFKAAYLNTLSVGTHKVKFQYSDGSAETTLVIKEAFTQDITIQDTTTQGTTTPSQKSVVLKTGDATPIAWLFIIAVICGAVMMGGVKRCQMKVTDSKNTPMNNNQLER